MHESQDAGKDLSSAYVKKSIFHIKVQALILKEGNPFRMQKG